MPDASFPETYAARPCLLRGRSLAFSPDWGTEGASVVFDRNSGDYWIVSPAARDVLVAVLEGSLPSGPSTEERESVIHELVRLNILAHT